MPSRSRSPKPKKPSEPRWQRRPEARPEEILDAAYEIFGEVGFARARLDDVARRAGVSKGTLYLYFDSKDALLREMVRTRASVALDGAEERLRRHEGSAADLLEALIRGMWGVMRRPQMTCMTRLVQGELGNFPELARFYHDEVVVRTRRLFERAIARGVASGEFRRVAHDYGARAIPAMLVQATQYQRTFAPYDVDAMTDEEMVAGIVDFALTALRIRPDARNKD